MKKVKIINIDSKGNFYSEQKCVLFVPQNQPVRFLCASQLLYQNQLFILHNLKSSLPFPQQTGQFDFKDMAPLRGDLQKTHWCCDFNFEDFSGSVKVQAAFGYIQKEKLIIRHLGKQDWLVVSPQLFRQGGRPIKLGQLLCQTLMPRAVGKGLSQWQNLFNHSIHLGYNSFHLPPILKLGQSNSYYSISDHRKVNTDLFASFQQMDQALKFARSKGALIFTDIVLNHISFDSDNLQELEHALYTPDCRPQLNALLVVDNLIFDVCQSFKQKIYQWPSVQVINLVLKQLRSKLQQSNFWKYFQLHADTYKLLSEAKLPVSYSRIHLFSQKNQQTLFSFLEQNVVLGITQEGSLPDIDKFSRLQIDYQMQDLSFQILKFNQRHKQEALSWINDVVDSVRGELTYNFIQKKDLQPKSFPLVKRAFSKLSLKQKTKYALNNGWVANIDPLQNFALSKNQYYLRRQVFIWGDLLKIDFGQQKIEKPQVWKYFQDYVLLMTKYFDGFRLDNLHGTPLHVAQRLISVAKKQKPKIIMFAELFTGSQLKDSIFVKRVGIDALVRQTKYIDSTSTLSGKLQFYSDTIAQLGSCPHNFNRQDQKIQILQPRFPSKILYDQSHDNQPQSIQKVFVVNFATAFLNIFTGTTYGVDFAFDCKVPVCGDNRLYPRSLTRKQTWNQLQHKQVLFTYRAKQGLTVKVCGSWDNWTSQIHLNYYNSGLYANQIKLKKDSYQYKFIVNGIWTQEVGRQLNSNNNHFVVIKDDLITKKSFDFQQVRQILAQIRQRSLSVYNRASIQYLGGNWIKLTKKAIDKKGYLVAILSTSYNDDQTMPLISVPGRIKSKTLLTPTNPTSSQPCVPQQFPCHSCPFIQQKCFLTYFDIKGNNLQPAIKHCLALLLQTQAQTAQMQAADDFIKMMGQNWQPKIAFKPQQINYLLFSTVKQQWLKGGYQYCIQGSQLPYCGLMGIQVMMQQGTREKLFRNIKEGDWLIDHHIRRLKKLQKFEQVISLLSRLKSLLSKQNRTEIPYFFTKFWLKLKDQYIQKILPEPHAALQRYSASLRLASFPFIAAVPSQHYQVTVAAGLPHFCTGWTRNWGRDTFIGFKGGLLLNGMFPLAQRIIMDYSQNYRFGLIPNLLDFGRNPRYNSRDAVWWYLKAILDYCEMTGSYEILDKRVQIKSYFCSQEQLSLRQIISKIFKSHAQGIKFREPRAGPQLDSNMESQGFNIQLFMDNQTGFIRGGNTRNCLTWMDKMGSSKKSGNAGWPATSRTGCPIQMVGILFHCLSRCQQLFQRGILKENQIQNRQKRKLTYGEWAQLIKRNFERWFFIDKDEANWHYSIKEEYVKIRQIYKDNVCSQNRKTQHFLRPNQLIAMALAPQLFTPERASITLSLISKHLLEPNSIGVKTLSPLFAPYRSYYDNSDDSLDPKVAHGFSYHNGPQWVWLYGYYVMAVKQFSPGQTQHLLTKHIEHLRKSSWFSLPQMTNENGRWNAFSCPAQFWSIATIQQALSQ